jgi:hypothetical protein
MEQIELEYVTIRYKAPIVYLTFKPGAELGFPEIEELTSYAEKLSANKPYLVLSDARAHVKVTPEGKKHSADAKYSRLQNGTAVIVKNTIYQLAANFFIGIQKPEFPFSVFTEEQKAIDWLLSLPLKEQIASQ